MSNNLHKKLNKYEEFFGFIGVTNFDRIELETFLFCYLFQQYIAPNYNEIKNSICGTVRA